MKIVFAGTPQISALALEIISEAHEVVLAITRPDALVGRNRTLTPSPVALKAGELGIPVVKANKFDEEVISEISGSGAQNAVVIAFGAMIPAQALGLLDWWNIHFSLLPMWRGASPLQHSMMTNGPSGVTIFRLDQGMDTGPVLAQQNIKFLPSETCGEALVRFTGIASNLVCDLLTNIPEATPQAGTTSYAGKIVRADARIDWSQPATRIDALVRAMNPEPMAWTEINGKDVKIIRTHLTETDYGTTKIPGAVFKDENGAVLVQCGDGKQIALIELQPSGKGRMPSSDWLNGQNKEIHFG